jgi:hypothetical protein
MLVTLAAVAVSAACSQKPVALPPAPRVVRETVTVRDPELDKRVARAELQLLARDAQIEDLQAKLEDTRAEVVRAMAKLQSVASRAQAASSMAEAEVALQTMKAGSGAGQDDPPEANQVTRLVRQAATEFDKQNYGGALYLANQAKTLVSAYRGRLTNGRDAARPGETPFAVPIKLVTTTRGNVRGGPGTGFPIVFAADSGTILTAFSYADEWIRISDDGGRGGWIFRNLVSRP